MIWLTTTPYPLRSSIVIIWHTPSTPQVDDVIYERSLTCKSVLGPFSSFMLLDNWPGVISISIKHCKENPFLGYIHLNISVLRYNFKFSIVKKSFFFLVTCISVLLSNSVEIHFSIFHCKEITFWLHRLKFSVQQC